jgi:hypothetical protein
MAKFVLAYRGGGMAEGAAAQEASMAEWMAWFGSLGDAVLDVGNPFGPACAVASNGTVSEGGSAGLSGYSIVAAGDLGAAGAMAQGCPVLAAGGSVDVYETLPIG